MNLKKPCAKTFTTDVATHSLLCFSLAVILNAIASL